MGPYLEPMTSQNPNKDSKSKLAAIDVGHDPRHLVAHWVTPQRVSQCSRPLEGSDTPLSMVSFFSFVQGGGGGVGVISGMWLALLCSERDAAIDRKKSCKMAPFYGGIPHFLGGGLRQGLSV